MELRGGAGYGVNPGANCPTTSHAKEFQWWSRRSGSIACVAHGVSELLPTVPITFDLSSNKQTASAHDVL